MHFTKEQAEDLKTKLFDTRNAIGFPTNQKQTQQLNLISRTLDTVLDSEDKKFPIFELHNFQVEELVELFEEYL